MKSIPEIIDLAWARYNEAELLLQERRADLAFYVAGYTVELLLKAMICKSIKIENFFDFDEPGKYLSKEAYRPFKVHDFGQLIVLAGMHSDLQTERQKVEFNEHWSLIKTWSENVRYSAGNPETNVKNFLISIKTVSEWIEKRLLET